VAADVELSDEQLRALNEAFPGDAAARARATPPRAWPRSSADGIRHCVELRARGGLYHGTSRAGAPCVDLGRYSASAPALRDAPAPAALDAAWLWTGRAQVDGFLCGAVGA
jgi:hypothetical protein